MNVNTEGTRSADGKTLAVTFDLQQVLTVPRLFAGITYYYRKLNTYNLTFYELQSHKGHRYYWTEAQAGRGANDVAIALVMYLAKLDTSGSSSHVVLYTDTWGGQNRNKVVIATILSFLETSISIKTVTQKYFKSGHSHMELHASKLRYHKGRESYHQITKPL